MVDKFNKMATVSQEFISSSLYYSLITIYYSKGLLNQARTGLRPARAWFLEIVSSTNVGVRVCVCVSAPEAINNKSRERHA